MSEEFDATLVYQDPVGEEVHNEQIRTVEHLMQRPNAMANAKLHAENELRRLIASCNRLAWRSVPSDLRPPSPEEANALLERLSPEDRSKLIHDARLAAEHRFLVTRIQEAYAQCLAEIEAEQVELAHHEEEERARAEFEALDAAGKEERYQTWRAGKAGNGA